MTRIHLIEKHTLTVDTPFGTVVSAIERAQTVGSSTMVTFSGDTPPCAINAAHVIMVTP